MKRMILLFTAALLAAGAWAKSDGGPFETEFPIKKLDARFYFDLGREEVDVSAYPKEQKANYKVFKRVCSQCHTISRPIHAPITEKAEWRRYIRRMMKRTPIYRDAKITRDDADKILSFLAYDSKIRKVDNPEAFKIETSLLKALFKRVQKVRSEMQIRESRKKARERNPYTGAKDRP